MSGTRSKLTPDEVGRYLRDQPSPSSNGHGPNAEAGASYVFKPAFPTGHFVSDYIAYAAQRTDAAHEYREAAACLALAAALRTCARPSRSSDTASAPTCICSSSGSPPQSRRSTAADYAMDLIDRVIPDGRLADITTPEAFAEQLARRNGQSATWFIDEFGGLLDKLEHAKYMAGLRGVMLAVYDGREHRYERHTKRTKHGRTPDADWIKEPNLSLLGNATPALFEVLTTCDVMPSASSPYPLPGNTSP